MYCLIFLWQQGMEGFSFIVWKSGRGCVWGPHGASHAAKACGGHVDSADSSRPADLARLFQGGGGGCGQGASNLFAKKCGKFGGNCGAVTKPPKASRSNTSTQGTHRAPKSTQGGQAKSNCGKIADNCGKLQKIAKISEKSLTSNPPPAPGLFRQAIICCRAHDAWRGTGVPVIAVARIITESAHNAWHPPDSPATGRS